MAQAPAPRARGLEAAFALALLTSATLLFAVQPMVGKILLPILGGTPAVWNACMVFFQLALLAGYSYAHLSSRYLPIKVQVGVHAVLLATPLLLLPIALPEYWVSRLDGTADPTVWLLGALALTVGLPFTVASATSPLLQRWFSLTDHPDAHSPYFLYAASNLGSLVALLGYPFVLEPLFPVATQSRYWSIGYGVLCVLILACGALTLGRRAQPVDAPVGEEGVDEEGAPDDAPAAVLSLSRQRAWWLLLAFIPSSLMLGVTTFLTTDIASIPLLWVLPLALYLLTFVLVFAKKPIRPSWRFGRAMSLVATLLVVTIIIETIHPTWLLFPGHILVFFLAAWVAHGRLADLAPEPERLTEFFFFMSLGGVLGGVFNALVAPFAFDLVWEYPIALALACAARPPGDPEREEWRPEPRRRQLDVGWPIVVGVVTFAFVQGVETVGLATSPFSPVLSFGVPALVAYASVQRPARFGAGLIVLCAVGALTFSGPRGEAIDVRRNFFGVLRTTDDPSGRFRVMFHGSTDHGRQRLSSRDTCEPLQYYHREGPMGDLFTQTQARDLAVVGLGTGSLACYARPEQRWTFYEIDPDVLAVASDPAYFTFLANARAESVTHVLGDARLQLGRVPDASYDVLAIDAFSSDAIPTHLMTREALALYFDKLKPGGLLAMHISNRVFDLPPVLAHTSHALGLHSAIRDDRSLTVEEIEDGHSPSIWMVLAREPGDLKPLLRTGFWQRVRTEGGEHVWTDDFSNVTSVIRWGD